MIRSLMIENVRGETDGEIVTISGFVSNVRTSKNVSFMILRSGMSTVQCVIEKATCPSGLWESVPEMSVESFVRVTGTVRSVRSPVKACTVQDFEIIVEGIQMESKAQPLPFVMRDAGSSEEERKKRGLSAVSYNKCLDNRSLELRLPHMQAIFKLVAFVTFEFRSFLRERGFIGIETPKLIGSSSEGGANCFQVDFFGRKAFLAQSPQLYKQMAVIGGLRRVFEVGHVYRAEVSNINRYLSEFVGLDIEMEIDRSYDEVIVAAYDVLRHIIRRMFELHPREIEAIRRFSGFDDVVIPETPLILSHKECVKLLSEDGVEISEMDDFSRENERKIGEIVKKKFGSDMLVVKEYPTAVRAFYTMPKCGEESISNSFDFILRGEEVLSGSQRVNDYESLVKRVDELGISQESLAGYLNAFKYGAPMHGGVGIGLERLLKALFGFSDIRQFSMFPRDASRIYP